MVGNGSYPKQCMNAVRCDLRVQFLWLEYRVCKKKLQSNSHTEERLQRYVYTLITRNEKRKGCKSTDRLFLFSDLLCDNFEWRKGCKFLIVLVLTVGSSTKLAAN